MFCALCGQHARHPKSPETELRRKECPRFTTGGSAPAVVHRGCCAKEACSDTDGRGHVRCAWAHGGKERVEQGIALRQHREDVGPQQSV